MSLRDRGARSLVAPLVLALAVGATAGCSSSGSSGPTPSATPTAASSATRVDAAAQRVVDRAIRRTTALRRYAFTATTTIAAARATTISLTGRVVRGQGLTYRLHSSQRRTEVVRLRHRTFVRRLHGHWHRLVHPRAITNPTASLVAVLRALRPTDVSGRRVHGSLAAAGARAAGIPTDGSPARVTLTVDRHGRVVALGINTATKAGANVVSVNVHTAYSRFGHVPAVRRPF